MIRNQILVFIFLISICSCLDEESTDDRYINPVVPNNNEIVFKKELFGTGESFFSQIVKGNSGFYVLGSLDDSNTTSGNQVGDTGINYILNPKILKFDNQGNEIITITPNINIYDFDVIEEGIIDNSEFVLVSGYDENEDDPDDPDRTRLMLYDSNMKIVSTYEQDFFQTINDFKIISSSFSTVQFMAVGSVWISGVSYPSILRFSINKITKKISYEEHWRYKDFDQDGDDDNEFRNVEFHNIFVENDELLVTGKMTSNNDETKKISILKFNINNLPGWDYWYSWDNKNEAIYTRPGQGNLHNGDLILVGSLVDTEKEKDRQSPFILSFNTLTQESNFYKKINESDNPDIFHNVTIYNNKFISCGIQSSYYSPKFNDSTVGNGWFYLLDTDSGSKVGEYSFGNKINRTRIRDFIIGDKFIWAVGYEGTHLDSHQAALYKIDKSILN